MFVGAKVYIYGVYSLSVRLSWENGGIKRAPCSKVSEVERALESLRCMFMGHSRSLLRFTSARKTPEKLAF